MKNNWTPEQLQAINAKDVSIIVSAAAGSGKTSVLVERLIRIICDTENKIPVNEMIIVTFTNDATSEMKHRLSQKLAEMIIKNPDNEWIVKQNAMLRYARISTINSFCFELIRENVQNTDVSAGFRVIDGNEELIIIRNCAEDIIENAYVEMPDEMDFLYNCFCSGNDKTIENMLISVHKYMEALPYSEYWLKKITGNLKSRDFRDKITKSYTLSLKKNIERCLENARNSLNLTEHYNDGDNGTSAVISVLEDDIQKLEKCCTVFESENPDYDEINNISFKTIYLAKAASLPDDKKETIKSARDEYKAVVKAFPDNISVAINSDRDIDTHIKVYEIITKLMENLEQKIKEVKILKNGLGFSDAEKIAIKLLSVIDENGRIEKSELATELSKHYKIIMVDEFQDSNNNQDLIFKLLSHNGTAGENGNNLFLVGDVKQAIYGFRLANPEIFRDTMRKSVPYSENTDKNSFIKLNKNFRSSPEVIGFVNYIFSRLMKSETGSIDYNDDEKLIQGAKFADTERDTEIALINYSDAEKDDEINLNAVWTAEKISSMLRNHAPVCNSDGVTVRPCENRDFCILMRSSINMYQYAQELKKRNIPFYIEEISGYLKSREISLMINLLKVIDNPLIDTALTAVMLSPMFSMTPDDVTEIRLANKDSNMYVALCTAIGKLNQPSEDELILTDPQPIVKGKLLKKAENLFSIITELRMYSATDTLEQLIRRIYERTDFLSVMQIYKDSENKKANLRILIEYAKSYESSSGGGLSGFLRFVEKSDSFSSGNTASGSDNVVYIKTIHKSKGLEFPFVFVCDIEKQFNTRDLTENPYIIDKDYGIGFKIQDSELLIRYTTVLYETIKEKRKLSLVNEEMRLLYVALTRAKDKLFIPVKISKDTKSVLKALSMNISENNGISTEKILKSKSFYEWIMLAVLANKNSAYLHKKLETAQTFEYDDDLKIKFTEFDSSEISGEIPCDSDENSKSAVIDMDYAKRLENSFRFFENEYNFELSLLPAKLSVSEIAGKDDEYNIALKRPKFIKDIKKLSPAEIGTAMHTFMQYADFKNMSANPENELDICVSKGFITQKERECINVNKIRRFTNSDIFKRIQNSCNVQRERKFMINIKDTAENDIIAAEYQNKDIILQGIADMIFEEDNELVIIDYKTDYVKSGQELIDRYYNQLMLYKLAFERIENKKVKQCLIYSFGLQKCISVV